ncbi:MAG TPA: sialidase family protein [Anaerolineales bacterium]|nr:sialidase family protein [Anaerolineales bacterium]
MSKPRIVLTLFAITLLSILWIAPAQAQGGGWSRPYRLSSEDGKSSEGYLVADRYGYVHCFWTETRFDNGQWSIKYSRFDGATWTKPNDIYLANRGIRNVSPYVDQEGILHIAWAEGLTGPAYYTHAPANNAFSAQSWAKPVQINVPARVVYLRVDSKGVFHMLYIDQAEAAGVYYIRSEDQGRTWSLPLWIDPDILPNHIPDSLSFELDENDGLHAAWFYGTREQGERPDWVRYAHSLDAGQTWSAPFLIDQHDEARDHRLTAPSPVMIVQGQVVHIIWAAGSSPYRNHRFSVDAGRTWSPPEHIFGELHGQAFDGLTLDGAGRVHFLGQIRYPMGIYHAYWDQNGWNRPSLVYMISEDGASLGDRVHAHHTLPVIRAGNQLVLTFADGPADPNRRLFVMYQTLDDIPPLEAEPTPVSTVTPLIPPGLTPLPSTPMPSQTAKTPSSGSAVSQSLEPVPAPDLPVRVALLPTVLVLVGMIIFQLYKRKR